jgi:hypothetical protein
VNPSLKRFLAHAAAFFLPLFAAAFVLDWWISAGLRRSLAGELGAWNEIYAGHINSDIVVYGTSRAVGQFDPHILSDTLGMTAYNLGMQGNNFAIQYLRHEVLLRHNSPPRLIVQSVEPFTFLKQHKGLYDPVQFLPYVLDDPQVRAATTPFGTFDFWDRHLPLVRYCNRAVNVATAARLLMMYRDRVAERDRGYKTLSMPWDGNSDPAALLAIPGSRARPRRDRAVRALPRRVSRRGHTDRACEPS